MTEHFRAFIRGLRPLDYCVDCLARFYDEPAETIRGYLRDEGIVGRQAECSNCTTRKETFRFKSSEIP